MALSAAFIKTVNRPGRYGDGHGGHGLALVVKPRARGGIRKAWVQRIRIAGKETNVGLGSWPVTGLADARAKALANARLLATGQDPRRATGAPTFGEATEQVIALHRVTWRDAGRSEKQWRASLGTYAGSLADKAVSDVSSGDVLAVLAPIWSDKPETARRVRGRISAVMKWAMAEGHRPDNPAGDAVAAALPRHTSRRSHHPALHHSQVGAAVAAVQKSGATAAVKLALEFLTLTACRSGEVRGCRWDEIDLQTRTWTVPPSRTKTAAQHRVPLSTRAVEVLGAARRLSDGNGLVFASTSGKMLSDATMSKLMRELDLGGTPHGMRAAFRSWCSDTAQPRDLAEQALGHAVRGVEAAYARSDMLERRRDLMQQWADYLAAPTPRDISHSEAPGWNSGPAAESDAAGAQPLAAHDPSRDRSSLVGQSP